MSQTSQESLYLHKEEYTGKGHVLTDYEEICCMGAFAIWQYEREKKRSRKLTDGLVTAPVFYVMATRKMHAFMRCI